MKSVLLLILCTTCNVLAGWSPLVRVDDNCQTELKRATMFIDQNSKVTHYFWCQYDTHEYKFHLLYRSQSPTGQFTPVKTLDTEHECEEVSVTGAHDGSNINVAYGADRAIAHTHCSVDLKDGCLDVYSLDSSNGGQTWTKPVQVFRKDQGDIWNRQYPKIIRNPMNGRLWIFYVLSDVEHTMYSIGYVTRPRGSSLYTQEVLLGFRKELVMGVTVALSNYGGQLLIHLIWTGELNGHLHLMQAISPNNGASWTTSHILGTGFAGKFTSNILMDSGYMVLPYLEYSYAPSRIAVTSDRTHSWRLKQLSENSGIADVALCSRYSKSDAMLFTLLNAEIGVNKYEAEFGYMHLSNEVWTRGENPFGNMNLGYDPNIRCYAEKSNYVVKAIGIEGLNKLFLTQNSFH